MPQTVVFGALLRTYRMRAGLSQFELAERAGISARTIGNMECESGHVHRRDTLERLVSALELSPEEAQELIAARHADRATLVRRRGRYRAPDAVAGSAHRLFNAPAPLTPLLGRQRECDELKDIILKRRHRLITITGPGGIGKTHLALHIAPDLQPHFTDGLAWVSLASLRDVALLFHLIARALDLREDSPYPVDVLVRAHLQGRDLVLLIDNCEHLLPEIATHLADLLAATPTMIIVATSRAELHVRGEAIYPLNPLGVPAATDLDLDAIERSPAVQLFVERVQPRDLSISFAMTHENAGAIAAICQRLDGIPLAIELAAAQTAAFFPRELLHQLEGLAGYHALLVEGPRDLPERQHTLQSTIAWSYDLLPSEVQWIFRRLAVFAGGWTFEAFATICAKQMIHDQDSEQQWDTTGEEVCAQGLDLLIEHHLVQRSRVDDELRYTMLDTVHHYAWKQLRACHEDTDAVARHTHYYLTLAETAEPHYFASDQAHWSLRIDRDLPNFRLALHWALATNALPSALRLVTALTHFWARRGYHAEGIAWQSKALSAADELLATNGINLLAMTPLTPSENAVQPDWLPLYVKALARQAYLLSMRNDFTIAATIFEQCLTLFRVFEDTAGEAQALNNLGEVYRVQGNYHQAIVLYEKSLELKRSAHDLHGIANSLNNLGLALIETSDYSAAERVLTECLELRRATQNPLGTVRALANLGYLANATTSYVHARDLLEESLALWRDLEDPVGLGYVYSHLADAYCGLRDYPKALAAARDSLSIWLRAAIPLDIAEGLEHVAHVLSAQTRFRNAIQLFAHAAMIRQRIDVRMSPHCTRLYEADLAQARDSVGETIYLLAWRTGTDLPGDTAIGRAYDDLYDHDDL